MADRRDETYRSMVSLSTEAIKSLFLLNGGAVVVVLAYLGQAKNGGALAQFLAFPLALFVIGLVLAGLTFFFAYFTQLALYNQDVGGKPFLRIDYWLWLTGAFITGAGSLALFAEGGLAAVKAFGVAQ